MFLRIISRESPQQYTRLFTISTVYSRTSSFTLHSDWKDTDSFTGCWGGTEVAAGSGAADVSSGRCVGGAAVGGGVAGSSEREKCLELQ